MWFPPATRLQLQFWVTNWSKSSRCCPATRHPKVKRERILFVCQRVKNDGRNWELFPVSHCIHHVQATRHTGECRRTTSPEPLAEAGTTGRPEIGMGQRLFEERATACCHDFLHNRNSSLLLILEITQSALLFYEFILRTTQDSNVPPPPPTAFARKLITG